MSLPLLALGAIVALPFTANAAELPIPIVAAETFYGEVAAAIGGDRVAVESVAISPDSDPHDFAPPPSVARAVAEAKIVIMNGLDYDHWMEQLLEASPTTIASSRRRRPPRRERGRQPASLVRPAGRARARRRADRGAGRQSTPRAPRHTGVGSRTIAASLDELNQKIAAIRDRYAGTEVAASEPVFGLMAEALGLEMLGADFQHAVMNETEPSAARDRRSRGRHPLRPGEGPLLQQPGRRPADRAAARGRRRGRRPGGRR